MTRTASGLAARPALLYISPEFPKVRHGFEAAELRSLATAYDVCVVSLRRPTASGVDWLADLDDGWPIEIRTLHVRDVAKGCIRACVRQPTRLLRVLATYAVLCVYDIRGGVKAVLSGLAGVGIFEIARTKEPSWIHADFASAPASAALVTSRLTGVPWSFTGHAFDVFSSRPAGRATSPLLAQKMHEASVVFAENSEIKRRLDALSAATPNATISRLHRNGIHPPRDVTPVRLDPFIVVGLGALTPKKGFDTLVRAAGVVKDHMPIHVIIHGEGPERERLSELGKAVGVDLDLPGTYFPSHLSGILEAASVVVIPSRVMADGDSDGVPTVLIEALAHRRPVIGTEVGAVTDLVRHHETGLVVPPDSPDALARALLELAADPQLADRLAAAGRDLVKKEFTAEVAFRSFQDEVMPLLASMGAQRGVSQSVSVTGDR